MHDLIFFQKEIEEALRTIDFPQQPAGLYDPIRYMLHLGGKRIRPSLVLMGCELFGGDYRSALPAALGIEVFHNFTLLHDDIMDKAPLRRSQSTVHTKWNSDVAILSGDAMFVKSCQLMMQCDEPVRTSVMNHFLKTALQVCEGQQWDMTFEVEDNVTLTEYLDMIALKTAVLLGCALKIGALTGGAGEKQAGGLYEFGKNLGLAFQLHDDLLDVYGDAGKIGKQVGGDIRANKKTFLLLKAKELASSPQRKELDGWLNSKASNEKVQAVKELFRVLDVRSSAEQEMQKYFDAAMASFHSVNVPDANKKALMDFAEGLLQREA